MGIGSCARISLGRETPPMMSSPPAPWTLIHWIHGDQCVDKQGMFFAGASLSLCHVSVQAKMRRWAPPGLGIVSQDFAGPGAFGSWARLAIRKGTMEASDASPSLCRWGNCRLRGDPACQKEAELGKESWRPAPSRGLIKAHLLPSRSPARLVSLD